MSWMQRLYETYEHAELLKLPEDQRIMPICHIMQNAHINIIIDGNGNFKKAKVLPKKTQVILPATEDSAGRSSGVAPHPLADKIQYVAKDYVQYGGEKQYFVSYESQLKQWAESQFSHLHVKAVLAYISRGQVIQDLVKHGILYADENKRLLTTRPDNNKIIIAEKGSITEEHNVDIFTILTKEKGETKQESAMVCWSVEVVNAPLSDTWKNEDILCLWTRFYKDSLKSTPDICYITGSQQIIASKHTAKIRHTGDKAKLISSNDSSGYTFRGRFIASEQATVIGFDVTQKAHNTLSWLVSRQGIRNGDQVIVVWAISGKPIPNPLLDPYEFSLDNDIIWTGDTLPLDDLANPMVGLDLGTDLGERIAGKFKLKLKGYKQNLDKFEQLSILALDSATSGRMSVTYYQEQMPGDYFCHLDNWYQNFEWYQRCTYKIQTGSKKAKSETIWSSLAPSPFAITQATYGKDVTDVLKRQLYMRILPCITEGRPFPEDILNQCVMRACNPNSVEHWEWDRNIGVACALYRGFYSRHPDNNKRRNYTMGLDINNASRDYLYGRLLAVAERLEEVALRIGGEKRRTTAERYMQQFAEKPFNTWRNIELALDSTKARLRASRVGFLNNREKEITEITNMFQGDDYCNPSKLTGEFLLGYHCQKMTYLKNEKDELPESGASQVFEQ